MTTTPDLADTAKIDSLMFLGKSVAQGLSKAVKSINPEIADDRFIRVSCSSCSGNYYFLPGMMPAIHGTDVPCPVCQAPATTAWEVLSN